jgi:rod shape-determining protein MreC
LKLPENPYIISKEKSGDQMSRFTKVQKIIMGCIVAIVLLGFIIRTLAISSTSIAYDAFTMLRYGLIEQPLRTAQSWLEDFSSLWAVKEENDALKMQLAQQMQLEADLEEAIRKNAEYETMLELGESVPYEKIYANVLVRDQELWNNEITISKGAHDGIQKDMAVMSNTGVIGKISETGEFTSKVKLLTSQDHLNNVSVKINLDGDAVSEGVLERYDAEEGLFIIHLFDDTSDIQKDMKVVTSGKGGVYPSGLLIGTVNSVQSLKNQIGKSVYVVPSATFQSFDVVMVINQGGS